MDNEKKSSIYMYVKKNNNNNKESIKKYLIDGTQVNLIFFFFKSLIARKLSSL